MNNGDHTVQKPRYLVIISGTSSRWSCADRLAVSIIRRNTWFSAHRPAVSIIRRNTWFETGRTRGFQAAGRCCIIDRRGEGNPLGRITFPTTTAQVRRKAECQKTKKGNSKASKN